MDDERLQEQHLGRSQLVALQQHEHAWPDPEAIERLPAAGDGGRASARAQRAHAERLEAVAGARLAPSAGARGKEAG